MPCEEVKFKVNDREFSIMQWPPRHALRIKAQILKQVGSFNADFNVLSLKDIDPDAFVSLAVDLTRDVMSIEKKKKIDFDEYFIEYPQDLYGILGHVIMIQFAPFFEGVASLMFRKVQESLFQKQD